MRLVIVCVCLLFAACSPVQDKPPPERETLQDAMQRKDSESAWSEPVHAARKERAPRSGLRLSAENVVALSGYQASIVVYPKLEGFGSLDVSLLDGKAMNAVAAFCGALLKADSAAALRLTAAQCAPLVYIFLADIKGHALERYIIGSPLVNGTVWQVPVRFFSGRQRLDFRLYVNYGGSIPVIDQIAYGDFVGG
ncbi:hypothetical protein [Treponema endosymbiont of Eucomonympha sp.]|uniref:hypothetical protein n=1 Tax=Treponema endosymbiont of Eucomonympha sp. TaxID=1580831 RepID=UPI000ABBEE88|nr:hypothetical protein [Treponema endosymbiont of Eucomonympha sp.]